MIVVELYNDVFDVEVSSSSLEVSVSQEAQVLDATVLKDTDALLQEKVVSINKNGETVITPDDGFDGMETVKVDANIDPLSQCGYAEFDFVTDRGNNNSIWRRIKRINASCFDTSKITNMGSMFYACSSLTTLDLSNFDTSKVTDIRKIFSYCITLKSIIGDKSLEDVENGTVALKGTKINLSIGSSSKLRYSSMLALTKGLADLTGQKAQTISFRRNVWNNMFNDDDTKPTADVIAERQATLSAIAASKNWNLSY